MNSPWPVHLDRLLWGTCPSPGVQMLSQVCWLVGGAAGALQAGVGSLRSPCGGLEEVDGEGGSPRAWCSTGGWREVRSKLCCELSTQPGVPSALGQPVALCHGRVTQTAG